MTDKQKPIDDEIFPGGIDPLTRRTLAQGWKFEREWCGKCPFDPPSLAIGRRVIYKDRVGIVESANEDWASVRMDYGLPSVWWIDLEVIPEVA